MVMEFLGGIGIWVYGKVNGFLEMLRKSAPKTVKESGSVGGQNGGGTTNNNGEMETDPPNNEGN